MAVRNDFTAGEVLAAADLNDTFASKVDYALPTNAQTGTTYTFVAADAEKLTTASNASPVTLTIPPASSVAWPDNTVLRVVNYGAGAVTIDGGSGVTVTNTASTIAQYGAAVAIRTGSDAWTVVPFGGGDIPAAEVSSPAATGQYTDGSGDTWDYYTFTSSGTLTVDTAGFADILVIGGGGSGGGGFGGGGGGGGYLSVTDAYLPAATHTITIGAGGVYTAPPGGTGINFDGQNGNDSNIGSLYIASSGGAGAGSIRSVPAGNAYSMIGFNGGSGGGASGYDSGSAAVGGSGSVLGNDGGTAATNAGGGGGGAGAVGANATSNNGGNGGAGSASSITGSSVTRAGGGGGRGSSSSGSGGTGGGGGGGAPGTAGTANTGGGGGSLANGGSGVVIVRVKV